MVDFGCCRGKENIHMTLKEFYEKAANDTELQAKVAEAAKSGKALGYPVD